MVRLELVHDEADFFRFTRIGNWIHVRDYKTGEGDWTWQPEEKPKICLEHPRSVHYDGETCPACQAVREWLGLTDSLFPVDAPELTSTKEGDYDSHKNRRGD
jgi:hypothetical protein